MMRIRFHIVYIATLGCMCLSGCSANEDDIQNKTAEISLSAMVDEMRTMSRAESSMSGTFTADLWLSLEKGKYPAQLPNDATEDAKKLKDETNIPVHTTISFQGEASSFPNSTSEADKPRYPLDNTPVYCVGFYPESNEENGKWEVNYDYTKASHAITGKQDLMFAPQITGSWNNHFDSQRFRHLLTWLKICVCPTTPEAGKYWGKLKKITLKDVPMSLDVDLSVEEDKSLILTSDNISASQDTQDLDIFDNPSGVDLEFVPQEVTTVYCYPESSYTLVVECEDGNNQNKTKEIKIDLSALEGQSSSIGDFPYGRQYILILNFHPFNVVEGVCTLNAWENQDEDLYPDANN